MQIVFAKSISKSVEDAAPSDELFEREKTGSLCFDVDMVKSFQGKTVRRSELKPSGMPLAHCEASVVNRAAPAP